jgi:hypothetical protein
MPNDSAQFAPCSLFPSLRQQVMRIPPHDNRTPEEIVGCDRAFDSKWHFWQALSWIDYAKRKTSIAALQYAALELRLGIEQLWFEIIIVAVGGKLELREYSECKGDSTKMYKILDRLSPNHAKLVCFSNIAASLDPRAPQLVEWDIGKLKRLYGQVSDYLHFLGHPAESTDSSRWFVKALTVLETGANYVWHPLTTGRFGQLRISDMPPEVKDAWEGFRDGQLSEDDVRTRLQLAQPVLRRRRLNA